MVVPKLFISHAADDKPLAKAFEHLLEFGIGVPSDEIFCSSLKGQGIRPGSEFKDSIRKNLDGASTVVALLSENFYNSPFCMCELGGVWLNSKDFMPLLVPPATFDDMKAVLKGLQGLKLDREEDLDELRDELKERLALEKPRGTPRWNEQRDKFLSELKGILKGLPKPPIVPRDTYKKVKAELKEFRAEVEKLGAQLEEQKRLVGELKKTKDQTEVNQVLIARMPEWNRFEDLVEAARDAIDRLDSTTKEALFLAQNDEDYVPDQWDDAKKALQYKEVTLNDRETGVRPNLSKSIVSEASRALEALQEWLASDKCTSDFEERYDAEYADSPDVSDRSFWDRHLW